MPSDAICVLHTQIPREPRTEPNEPRFRKILLGLVSVYWLLISVRSRSRPRSKKPDRYRFEPPNRYRAPSSLGSFAGLGLVFLTCHDCCVRVSHVIDLEFFRAARHMML